MTGHQVERLQWIAVVVEVPVGDERIIKALPGIFFRQYGIMVRVERVRLMTLDFVVV